MHEAFILGKDDPSLADELLDCFLAGALAFVELAFRREGPASSGIRGIMDAGFWVDDWIERVRPFFISLRLSQVANPHLALFIFEFVHGERFLVAAKEE